MTIRTVRVETPVLDWAWRQVVSVEDSVPLYAALIASGRLTPYTPPAGQAVTTDPNALLRLGDLADDLARDPEALISGTVTRNPSGMVTAADVTWPDGTPGVYTATVGPSGAVDSYTVTYGVPPRVTYTQPPVVRDASGAVTTRPSIVVS